MQNELQNNVFFDKKFIFMLMLELFEIEDMIQHRLDAAGRSIIHGIFSVTHCFPASHF